MPDTDASLDDDDDDDDDDEGARIRSHAARDSESFWAEQAQKLAWFEKFDSVLEWNLPFARWFSGGYLNACYNAVDVHLQHDESAARRNAIIWEAEDGARRTLTYGDLHAQVQRLANALLSLGIKQGDRVMIYLPMVPEIVIAMLGCARIGAIHTVVFSGFSAASLQGRISDSGSRVVITADGAHRRGRTIDLKGTVDEALRGLDDDFVQSVIVLQRTGGKIDMLHGRDAYWHDVVDNAPQTCDAVPVKSDHPLFILYTSGTTGRPKGVLHGTGGYLTHVHSTFGWAFGAKNEHDVYFCTADVGWITGHSYVVYAPLLHGVTLLMYEGAPDYPDASRMWQIIRDHKVTIFYTTPTLLRMLMRTDAVVACDDDAAGMPHNDNNNSYIPGLDTLRLLGTVGEPINPEVWRWYHKRVGGERCPDS